MNLNHRIIALIGNQIQRVHCLTCGGDHKYYPPKHEKQDPSERKHLRVVSPEKPRKTGQKTTARTSGEWTTFMKEMPPDTSPRPYRVSDSYSRGDFIEHPQFGVGKVLDIVAAEKMQVVFREGRKILICNRCQGARMVSP
jgi:hypothetical protein